MQTGKKIAVIGIGSAVAIIALLLAWYFAVPDKATGLTKNQKRQLNNPTGGGIDIGGLLGGIFQILQSAGGAVAKAVQAVKSGNGGGKSPQFIGTGDDFKFGTVSDRSDFGQGYDTLNLPSSGNWDSWGSIFDFGGSSEPSTPSGGSGYTTTVYGDGSGGVVLHAKDN